LNELCRLSKQAFDGPHLHILMWAVLLLPFCDDPARYVVEIAERRMMVHVARILPQHNTTQTRQVLQGRPQ
jgi:hypothetical protein